MRREDPWESPSWDEPFIRAVVDNEPFLPDQLDIGHGEAIPERRLHVAIIRQAVYDIREPISDEHWFRAAAWVTGADGSDTFDAYCGQLGIDPDAIIERLEQDDAIPKDRTKIRLINGRKSTKRHARRKRI